MRLVAPRTLVLSGTGQAILVRHGFAAATQEKGSR